jgi:hypothetical protein
LSGALALDKEDRAVVIPDSAGLKTLIAKGFFDLQNMRKRTPMVERSEAFLRELLRAAERATDKKPDPAPASVNPSTSLQVVPPVPPIPNEAGHPIEAGDQITLPEAFDDMGNNALFGEGSPSLIEILAAAGPANANGMYETGADLQSFEDLLQNSFDVWNFFQSPEMEGQPQLW